MGGNHRTIAPVLSRVIVGIIEIDPHRVFVVPCHAQDGDGMPSHEATSRIGCRNSGRLWVDDRLATIVLRVIRGMETRNEILDSCESPGGHIDRNSAGTPHPPTMKLRVDPNVRIV